MVWIGLIRMYDVDAAAMPYIKILTAGWQTLTAGARTIADSRSL